MHASVHGIRCMGSPMTHGFVQAVTSIGERAMPQYTRIG